MPGRGVALTVKRAAWTRAPFRAASKITAVAATRQGAHISQTDSVGAAPSGASDLAFRLTRKGSVMLDEVRKFNIKYSRGGQGGEGHLGVEDVLAQITNGAKTASSFYSPTHRNALLRASEEVQARMRIKVSDAYLLHALNVPENAREPNPILHIVMPHVEEIMDKVGEADPSNQNRYSPMPGLLHKYEMLLAYVSINCSSHCRYCYRSDLFNGISEKEKADMDRIALYASTYNRLISRAQNERGVLNPETGLVVDKTSKETLLPIREILFSGGDALTLPNATLARYLAMMAESGLKTVRLGTKELVFNPERFDANFFGMLDIFHRTYPTVRIEIMGHYTHPFELVDARTDANGRFIYDIQEEYALRSDLQAPLAEIHKRRSWLGHFNQFPIIAGVNDSPDVLRTLVYLCNRNGIGLHNIYACREIIGSSHFRGDNDIAAQHRLVEAAKAGLSGVETHVRLIMSTELGKVEVVDASSEHIYCRVNRHIHGNMPSRGTFFSVDTAHLPGGKLKWLSNDIMESDAVCAIGRSLFLNLQQEESALIRSFKTVAAALTETSHASAVDAKKDLAAQGKAVVIVKGRLPAEGATFKAWTDPEAQDSQIVVDLNAEKKGVTLAHVLSRHNIVEAACECSLSCSTCVGATVQTPPDGAPNPLPDPATEDELDVIDSVIKSEAVSSSDGTQRATCCVRLRPGWHYQFSPRD